MKSKFDPLLGKLRTVDEKLVERIIERIGGGVSNNIAEENFTEYIFNSTGTQTGNRYNNWADLETKLQNTNGYKRVTFENTSVVAPPFFNEAITLSGNYNDVVFRGNGTPAASGGILVAIDGSVSSWNNCTVENGLGFIYVGASSALMSVTNFGMKLYGGSALLSVGGQAIFSHSTGTLTIEAYGGSILAGASLGGNALVAKGSGAGTVLLIANDANANIESNIVTGTAGIVEVIMGTASSADLTSVTMSGFSGTYRVKRLAKTTNIEYQDNYKAPADITATYLQPIVDKLRRGEKRVTTVTSSATPTFNIQNTDLLKITALAVDITSMTTNMSGTPVDGQELTIRIKDDGTIRNITWGANFADYGAGLLASTTSGKVHTLKFVYDSVATVWGCILNVTQP